MQTEPRTGLLELLLGGELGDGGSTEGLTPSALQEYLAKVDVRREEVLLTLYANMAERFTSEPDNEAEEGSEATAGAGAAAGVGGSRQLDAAALDADAAFAAALARLQEQQELAAEDPAVAHLAQLAAQHAGVLDAMQQTVALAASVRVAAELQQRLADFDAAVAAGNYSEAAWIAVELDKAVLAVPGSEETAAAVAARAQPLQQQLLQGVYAYCSIDLGSRLPVLLPSAADEQQQQQPGQQGLTRAAGGSGAASTSSTGGEGPGGAAMSASAAVLAEIWRALAVFGLLPQALQQLATYFLEQSVAPILASEHDPSLITDSPAGSVASSNLSRATTVGGSGRGGGSSVERLLYKALRSLTEQVLGGQQEYAEQLGALLWPQLAVAYIAAKLKPIQPRSDAEVEQYSRKSALGAKLEQKAVKLHLLPEDNEGPITRYIKHTLNRFLNLRRNRFIAAARDLLLSAAAQEAVTVGVPRRITAAGTPKATRALFGSSGSGQLQRAPSSQGGTPTAAAAAAASGGLEEEDSLLACGEYSISKAAQGAVNLTRDALTEAVRSGNAALAQAMCGAVVDVAAMVVALPPPAAAGAAGSGLPQHSAPGQQAAEQQQQQQLLLPYPASLRHNDCHFIHQALCNLPYQFAPRLQQLVHRNVNFINPATRVRRAGQECLVAMVRQQEAELLGVVDDLQGFAGLDADGQAGIRCRKGVQQLLHAFRRLGSVLRGVLAPGVLVEVAAQLIQSVCAQIAEEIMCLPDISVDESEQIPQILEPLTSGLQDAVLLPGGSGSGSGQQSALAAAAVGGVPVEDLSTALAEPTPAVMKLRELCELLDIRLVEIRRRWQEGRLQAIGFSAEEVAHLVQALFEDTDLRRDFLHLVAQQQEGEGLL